MEECRKAYTSAKEVPASEQVMIIQYAKKRVEVGKKRKMPAEAKGTCNDTVKYFYASVRRRTEALCSCVVCPSVCLSGSHFFELEGKAEEG